ncbi:hypothetical protein, partial [Stenotrophomonas maltophilia]|uniref:hypothetical protein n=1 Tax=Stenotrophomonas maltophilia TaxID=40324 RepID=UPI001954DA21
HTLEAGGLIEHRDGFYALSYGLLELFSGVDTGRPLREIAGSVLLVVAAETSATAFLWVYKDGMAICVERVRPPQSLVE